MTEYLLKAKNVHKSFAAVHALNGVSLEIKPGEIHCLAGENGSGKSTLIKVISGVYQRDSGTIEFNGEKFPDVVTPIEAIKRGIQIIYQDFSIFPNLTVMENLAINNELAENHKTVSWKRMRKIAEEAIARINFKVDLDVQLGTLSVADKQLVAISRALMFNAKLIIMDEPTTALTRKEVQSLFDIILKLKEEGIAILFVSHKLDEVFEISERFTIFRNGKHVITGNTDELDDERFTYYMTGREFEHRQFTPKYISKETTLEIRNLTLANHYENINFSVKSGEILGITGLLDSGRTELALSLFGLKPADSGDVLVKGEKVVLNSPTDAMASNIGFVPEDRLSEGLFLPQSIGDNMVFARIDDLTNERGIIDKDRYDQEIENWVDQMSIDTPNPDNACSTLSGGNQQRALLGKWLATKPEILILSGPTVGVDIGSKFDIHGILQNLADEGMTIIIISDDLPEILENCSKILILKDGKKVQEVDSSDASEQFILEHML